MPPLKPWIKQGVTVICNAEILRGKSKARSEG